MPIDQSVPLPQQTTGGDDQEQSLGTCRCCLQTLPLRMLDAESLCANTFSCWVAQQDLSEYLDVHGQTER